MATTYSVRVLRPSEWNKLTKCPHVDEDSMGFADARMGKAYVRDTHAHELNKYLINHEFEHLLESKGTDECPCGLRHKKGSHLFRNLFAVAAAPFTGGASLSLGSQHFRNEASDIIPREITQEGPLGGFSTLNPGQPIGRTLRGGLPAWGTAAALVAPQALGLFSKGAMAGRAIPTATQAPGGVLSSLGTAPGGGAGEAVGRFIRPLSQSGFNPAVGKSAFNLSGPLSGSMRLGSSLGGTLGGGGSQPPLTGLPRAISVVQGAQATAPAAAQPGLGNALSKLFSNSTAKGLAVGGGLSLIGDLFAKKPQVPDFGSLPDVQKLRESLQGGLSPLGKLGQQQLSSRLQSPFGGLEPGVESSIRDTFSQQRRNLISQFKALRPNADLTTDSAYRQALFELDQQEAQAVGTARETAFQNFQQTRTGDIAQALGVDQQTVETLAALANADIATIMAQLGVDAAEAQQFKQTWANLGSLGALGVMGAFNPSGTP